MAVNAIFEKTGLLYNLSEYGMVERIVENSTLSKETETAVAQIKEKGIRELLNGAILSYKTPAPSARQNAVEKIWDALLYLDGQKEFSIKDCCGYGKWSVVVY